MNLRNYFKLGFIALAVNDDNVHYHQILCNLYHNHYHYFCHCHLINITTTELYESANAGFVSRMLSQAEFNARFEVRIQILIYIP